MRCAAARTHVRPNAIRILALLGAAALVCGWLLLEPPRPATGVIRSDVVCGPGNRPYRRLVRVERTRANIVTTVTFADRSGGVGRATYIQPNLPPRTLLKSFLRLVFLRLGFPVRPPMALPLMSIPRPMAAGQEWHVRIVPRYNGFWTQGFGKAPAGAGLDNFPATLDGNRDTVYGERLEYR